MANTQNLMGASFTSLQAGLIGLDPSNVTGVGTSQTTAAAIISHLALVTGSASNTGAILPSGAVIGSPYFVLSVGGTAAKVYCPSGHTLNGTSNGGATFSAAGMLIFIRTSTTAWWCSGTATGTVA